MHLDCDLGDAQFFGDQLVHHAGSHEGEHVALAGSQRLVQQSKIRNGLLARPPFLIRGERPGYGVNHFLRADRLGQEVDSAGLHGLDGHRDIAMTGHKDDRDADTRFVQIYLKVKTAYSRQPDIEYQTAGDIREAALQQFGGRTEHLDA
jgi:hypothetical protein